MRAVTSNGLIHHVADSGPVGAPTVMFSNSLGTDLRLWDALVALMPPGVRLVRYDTRGHGLSDCPPGPYSIAMLAADAAGLIDALGCGPVIFVGLSMGGMIGQALAASRPDLIRALVLSNTAARMGDATLWQTRIGAIRADGLAPMASGILDRWFGPSFRARPEASLWGAMLARTPVEGYVAACEALATADLSATTCNLRLPVLAIAGSADGASPPELVAATAAMIPKAAFHVIPGVGHLPCVEAPAEMAAVLIPFLKEHTHV